MERVNILQLLVSELTNVEEILLRSEEINFEGEEGKVKDLVI